MKIFGNYFVFLQAVAWIPLYVAWRVFGQLKVYGKENLKGLKSPVIFAANHTSELDAVVLPARSINPFDPLMHMYHVSREKSFYNRTRKLKRIFYGGLFFQLVGAYPAIVGKKNYALALATHINFLKEGRNVCIFPEGRKSPDGTIQEGKGGIIYLAKEVNVPIIPVALFGYHDVTPKEFFLRKRQMAIMYGKPIYVKQLEHLGINLDELTPDKYKEIANRVVMKEIISMHKNLENLAREKPTLVQKPAPAPQEI